jgi:hypothetical protein
MLTANTFARLFFNAEGIDPLGTNQTPPPVGTQLEPDQIQCSAAMRQAVERWANENDITLYLERTEYAYAVLADALQSAGASLAEAEALTDILAEEGWGGDEDASSIDLKRKLAWLREDRA